MLSALLSAWRARLPAQCAVCARWPAQPVCDACVTRYAQPVPRCDTCALPVVGGVTRCGLCLRQPPPLEQCLAALDYDYPWATLISRFKFNQATGWAHTFASLMRSSPWVEPALERADRVLPVPLSDERLRERGYNQALLLARALSPKKTDAYSLLRIQHSAAQSTLPREQRLRNVQAAFAVEPRRLADLCGQRVVLVDDVMTTGASLFAAAQTLKRAGVAHLTGLVLARTA